MVGGYSYSEPLKEPRILSEGHARLYSDAGTIAVPKLDTDGRLAVAGNGKPYFLTSPSPVGFTWAFVVVDDHGQEVHRESGYILAPILAGGRLYKAQSEVGEFVALSKGFRWLATHAPGWSGEVCSDNHLALARVFRLAACRTLPPEWVRQSAKYRRRLGSLYEQPLNGHPTQEHLERGYGHSNYPVSEWNVVTDDLCKRQRLPALEDWYATRRGQADPHIQSAVEYSLARARALAEGQPEPDIRAYFGEARAHPGAARASEGTGTEGYAREAPHRREGSDAAD